MYDGESSNSKSDGRNRSHSKGGGEKKLPECRENRRRYEGKCLASSSSCFCCGKNGHKNLDSRYDSFHRWSSVILLFQK